MRVKEENEKAGLKLNVKKTKIMVSGSITSWQIEGGKVKDMADFTPRKPRGILFAHIAIFHLPHTFRCECRGAYGAPAQQNDTNFQETDVNTQHLYAGRPMIAPTISTPHGALSFN